MHERNRLDVVYFKTQIRNALLKLNRLRACVPPCGLAI